MSDLALPLSAEEAAVLLRQLETPDVNVLIEHPRANLNMRNKLGALVAAREREEKYKTLGLPWCCKPENDEPGGYSVCIHADEDEPVPIVRHVAEGYALLMAASPALAEQWKLWLEGEEIERDHIRAVLEKARWI